MAWALYQGPGGGSDNGRASWSRRWGVDSAARENTNDARRRQRKSASAPVPGERVIVTPSRPVSPRSVEGFAR